MRVYNKEINTAIQIINYSLTIVSTPATTVVTILTGLGIFYSHFLHGSQTYRGHGRRSNFLRKQY